MRSMARVALVVVSPFVVFGLAITAGFYAGSFIVGLLALAALFAGCLYVDKLIRGVFRSDMTSWLSSVREAQYSYAWDGYGMALDTARSRLHLSSKDGGRVTARIYSFSDIREWGFEAPGHQHTQMFGNVGFGVATGVIASNFSNAMTAETQTGFWVKVKDIEKPRWFVRFGGNPAYRRKEALIADLERWMEIFSQHVNHK